MTRSDASLSSTREQSDGTPSIATASAAFWRRGLMPPIASNAVCPAGTCRVDESGNVIVMLLTVLLRSRIMHFRRYKTPSMSTLFTHLLSEASAGTEGVRKKIPYVCGRCWNRTSDLLRVEQAL